ncbi:hypothetical protein SSP35_02_01580 [Streptomyces sp. NBRC 110611]|uniref:hypothetical protein n=1 Tax=Streptomyces sp. NBRC 110611 TaxID=1621259 RepID=UPI00083261B0|nr:hypothetical protein [Streptomyces sp. NBRC 110611]GAU65791.1 hypothetical protein SSP35_02_01580 [Streptomyces sp. NBRC 110611]
MTASPSATVPAPRPAADSRRAAASRLRAHAAALRSHARRLRASAAAVHWTGPEATAFQHQVEQLADRCSVAAHALTHSATHLDPS